METSFAILRFEKLPTIQNVVASGQHNCVITSYSIHYTKLYEVENPYWQHFCGETYFQHEPPIDPSSMTRWRQRVGKDGVERLLAETIEAARRGQVVKARSFEKIIIDTTVMEKAVAYPTDSRLLERGRQHLVKLANTVGIRLRQNYNREAPRLAAQVSRYAHAKQYRRMKAALKSLRTVVGRVWRDRNNFV